MKKNILITALAGTGKSVVCKELVRRGYEAVDIEDVEGLFAMYRKDTGELFDEYDNAVPEHIHMAEWRCDVEKLTRMLVDQKENIAFYCGIASNMHDLLPLFDMVVLLKANAETHHARLMNREGGDDIGNTEEGRQVILGWKDWWENEMMKAGALEVSAEG